MAGEETNEVNNEDVGTVRIKVNNIKPPEMIKNGENLDVYRQRLERWSRL